MLMGLTMLLSARGLAQGIIINELFNAGTNEEWIELLVVQDSLDIRSFWHKFFLQ